MTSQPRPRMPADRPQEGVDGFKTRSLAIGTGQCSVCLARMQPGKRGQRKRFCSLDCRRLAWAARMLSEALVSGRAEGLRAELRKLMGAA